MKNIIKKIIIPFFLFSITTLCIFHNLHNKKEEKKEIEVAIYVDNIKQNNFPPNDGNYNFDKYICTDSNVDLIWNNNSWNYELNNISKIVSCNLYFKENFEYSHFFNFKGVGEEWIVPKSGIYKVELWGASTKHEEEGFYNTGGYTSGNILLDKNSKLYLFLGGYGRDCYLTHAGGFNGGGNNPSFGTHSNQTWRGNNGAGATDIRLIGGDWNNQLGLRSRIMVAAAGVSYVGAGGLIGYNLVSTTNPATQVSGGTGFSAGGFGFGGNSQSGTSLYGSNAGSSGYYGGSGGYLYNGNYDSYNVTIGGGSSFISGHTGCVAIKSATDQSPKSNCTTGANNIECSKHYSGFYFSNTKMIDGLGYAWTSTKGSQELMPNPTGGFYPLGKGHSGNGYARITFINY